MMLGIATLADQLGRLKRRANNANVPGSVLKFPFHPFLLAIKTKFEQCKI